MVYAQQERPFRNALWFLKSARQEEFSMPHLAMDGLLRGMIKRGALSVIYQGGARRDYGDGAGPRVVARLSNRGARKIVAKESLGVGEAYMDGDLVLEEGEIWDLLELAGKNLERRPNGRVSPAAQGLRALRRRLWRGNDRAAARRNVAHHYDLSADLYRRFLDADLQYSCAYFAHPGMSLEEAQDAKRAHIAAKLRLAAGQSVLDMGCGWGGLALEIAGRHGASVTGVTLSAEQLAAATQRAEAARLQERARFSLIDWRDVAGTFDRIVSVGMFEHVGAPHYNAFFRRVGALLADDGVAVIHSICRPDGAGSGDPFIRKYIFPGGYIPRLSQVTAAVERAGLMITDVEILRLHYAQTLRCWRERFTAQREDIARIYDERFCRMWEYYLASCEMGFRFNGLFVFQVQIAKRLDALPITRDYMMDSEFARDTAHARRRKVA
jgi:cyclopropane-fatty-acyl-phospholipid synthase